MNDLDWQDAGACRTADSSVFFPDLEGCGMAMINQAYATAKGICASCPVRSKCLKYALDTNQEFGIWGGFTEDERKRMRQVRRSTDGARAQLRKAEARRLLGMGAEVDQIAAQLGVSRRHAQRLSSAAMAVAS